MIGDPLTGSAFEMNREMGHGGVLSLWSRGARSQFAGQEGDVSLDGRVATTMAGADYQKGRLMAGLSLAHSRGRGAYQGVSVGDLASSMTGLYPWLGYRMTERVTVWGVTGYGKGSLRVTPEKGAALKTGLSMAMAAAGLRGDLAASAVGGFGLAFKTDALWVATTNAGVEGPAGHLTATRGTVSRFRAGLEASRGYAVGRRLTLEPGLELGLRHDGGAAETGAGLDLGAGLIVFDAGTGLAVELQMRTLLVHHAEGFSERSVAVSFSFDPTPSTPLGFTAQVAPSWGGEATRGAEALWGRETMAGMAPRGGLATGAGLDAEARLRAAGRAPLRGHADPRHRHLGTRPGLPPGLSPRRPRRRGPGSGVPRRGTAAGTPAGWGFQYRRSRRGDAALVDLTWVAPHRRLNSGRRGELRESGPPLPRQNGHRARGVRTLLAAKASLAEKSFS